jgi:SHS2 domain-containing protein
MSKGLRTAAFPADVARARPTQPGLPVEIRPPWGAYLVERAPEGLRLTVEATTLARLFIDAARAMSDQLGELVDENDLGAVRAGSEARQLSVVAATADQLLAAWLGELLYSARQARHLFSTINVRRINPGHLRAELRGERAIRWHIDPLSVTIADARVATLADPLAKRFVAHVRLAPLRPPGRS